MSTRSRFPIEHVIVLRLENRSYDHMLGCLPNDHELAGDDFNLVDRSDPTSERVRVSNRSGYITAVDPAHDFVRWTRKHGAAITATWVRSLSCT
jgi:phospholipase C